MRMFIYVLAIAAALVIPFPSSNSAAEIQSEIAHQEPLRVPTEGLRRCAAFDHHVLWLIEEHAEAQEISEDEIVIASGRLHDARRLCASGRVAEALDVYSTIALERPRLRWFR
jgi:hypothetical protein